ncbi:MAG: hypothetical protein SFU86_21520 [Pirellulaceae bacterium]|nr:hypothetical protein [Pirellulaceae bacterium]
MNDDSELDPRLLDAATSPPSLEGEPAAEFVRAERSAFLALGRALDAENVAFREDEFLARLQQGFAAPETAPAVSVPARARGRSELWPLLFGAALSLAMMVAIVRIMQCGPESASLVLPPPNTIPEIVQVAPADIPSVTLPADPAPTPDNGAELPEIVAWTDPLDDEIEAATTQLQAAVGTRRGVDDSLTSLEQLLEKMSADLAADSL